MCRNTEKMQRRTGEREEFGFRDPFSGFGGFHRSDSLMSSFDGGRDPFEDPFFVRPLRSMMGPSMFEQNMFHSAPTWLTEPQDAQQHKSKGPIIEELSSDDDEETEEAKNTTSSRPTVQSPDEEDVNKGDDLQYNKSSQPQSRSYKIQSSTVTYGGINGAYYTSSRTRKTGGDGVTVEESKEADTTTGKATHRISKGIHDKGHSVTRKLNSDGKVDTLQMLHNLHEDELAGFEKAWAGKAEQHLHSWKLGNDALRERFSYGREESSSPRVRPLPAPAPAESLARRKITVPIEFL